jgi:serine/threonine protein kinase
MGEVYRASDTKLGHDVALKLLPEAFAADPDRLARVELEAKVLASLNHPGIAHLYGFASAPLERGARVHFIAMALVDGDDLAGRKSVARARPGRCRDAVCEAACGGQADLDPAARRQGPVSPRRVDVLSWRPW